MLITHLKTENRKKNLLTNTDNVLSNLSSNFIIGLFTLIFKLTELNVNLHDLLRVNWLCYALVRRR